MTADQRSVALRGGWRPFAVLGAAAVSALLFAFRQDFIAADVAGLYLLITVLTIAAVTAVGLAGRLRLWSSGFLFAVVLAAFHLGIPIVRLFGGTIDPADLSYTNDWFRDTEYVRTSLWLCVAALVGFTLGYLLLSAKADATQADVKDEDRFHASFATPGLTMVTAGTALYLGYAAMVAPSLFLGAGKGVYEATIAATAPIGWGTMLTSVGIIIAAAAPPSPARTWAIRVFAVFAVFTLAIGTRTAALYAIVAVVVAAARVRRMPSSRAAILLVVVGLFVVSSVEQIRVIGWSEASVGDFLGSPAAGLHEMGGSLRPVVETVAEVDSGEDLRHGETYFVSLIRTGETILGIEHPAEEQRWADAVIAERTPGFQIGYSTVAEAYLNFGAAGTFFAFLVLGCAFSWWDNRRLGDPVAAVRVAVVVVALLAAVRASSNVVLVTIVFGLLALELARRWSARRAVPALEPLSRDAYSRLVARKRGGQ